MTTRSVPVPAREALSPTDTFPRRHIGPDEAEVKEMLRVLGYSSLEDLIAATVPDGIRLRRDLRLPEPRGEHELIDDLHEIAARNEVFRSFIGMGYYDCITPPVILRNVLENPGWYTQYTPYQAEIAQGRLEALLNFQTMVADLTGLPLANASLLDEATAAAEAMGMCHNLAREHARRGFFVAEDCHPQTIAVVKTRDRLGKLLAVGVVAMWFSHVFINIGMNIRIMPVTGVPLPLLSYGGSSVLCSLIAAGILQNVCIHRRS